MNFHTSRLTTVQTTLPFNQKRPPANRIHRLFAPPSGLPPLIHHPRTRSTPKSSIPASSSLQTPLGALVAARHPWMTEMALPSLQLHSHCFTLSQKPGGWWNVISQFTAPMTLILTRWPSHTNLTWRLLRCSCKPEMNFLGQGFQILEQ